MNINHGLYADVKIAWHTMELPLKAGTPVSIAGVEANSADAFGIVPQTITHIPVTGLAQVLIGGEVSLVEVEKEYGAALTEDAKNALGGITFYAADGRAIKSDSGGGGGGDSLNVVFSWQTNKYVCDKTYSEVEAAQAAKTPIIASLYMQYGGPYLLPNVASALGGGRSFSGCRVWVDSEGSGLPYITRWEVVLSENNNVSVYSEDYPIGGGGDDGSSMEEG